MSKSVRLADYLYDEIELLAISEKRSVANMVKVLLEKVLLEQALRLPSNYEPPEVKVSPEMAREIAKVPSRSESDTHFRPDPK